MQKTLFSIRRLSETEELNTDIRRDEVIDIYLVLKGDLEITGRPGLMILEAATLYWACDKKWARIKPAPKTEGFGIRFSKSFLHCSKQELYCSFIAAFCPIPGSGQKISVPPIFLDEVRILCEMMLEEYRCTSDFRMDVLRSLFSIFLLHLIRRSDILMYVAGSTPHAPPIAREFDERQRLKHFY
ncbi:MAG: hypothetical protein JST68_00695 [Bacteroidetes bacterium]|nr:hypothetical protein [Bacteroidota bacterium]